jgi:hypothetical protein
MPIIDFLMDNLFFVMIALFFLSSMFAKKKKEAEAEAKRNARSQNSTRVGSVDTNTYDVDTYVDPYKERTKESKPNPMAVKVKQETISEMRESKDRLVKAEKVNLSSPIYADDLELSDEIRSSDLSNNSSIHLSLDQPSAKEAVNGMVWAEIFGPPRAKKPFRGGSYRK